MTDSENAEDLASLMTWEQGNRSLKVSLRSNTAQDSSNIMLKRPSEFLDTIRPLPERRLQTYKQAVGVVGAITPEFSASAAKRSRAGGGVTIVIKPDPATPLSALALCELARAGLPAGVLNVVAGSDSQDWRGSHAAPQDCQIHVYRLYCRWQTVDEAVRQHSEKISLELGGNAPFIVFEDANLEEAVSHCLATKFRNCG